MKILEDLRKSRKSHEEKKDTLRHRKKSPEIQYKYNKNNRINTKNNKKISRKLR